MDIDDDTPTTEQPTQAADPAPPPPASPQLMRSNDDRLIAGVCGGIAERYGVDVGFVRILAVILALIGGVTVFAYLAAVLLLPQNDGQGNPVERVRYRRIAQLTGFAAIGVAVALLLGAAFGGDSEVWGPSFGGAVACLLVIALAVTVGQRLRAPAPGKASPPTAGRVAGVVLIGAAACLGAGLLIGLSTVATVFAGAVPAAIAVLAIGVLMLGLAAMNRRALWLAIPALAIAAPATLLASADIRVDGSVGERSYAPPSVDSLLPVYKLGVGEMVIDLRRMEWPEGDSKPLQLRVDMGIGDVRVIVASSTCVATDMRIKAGEERVLGSSWSGTSLKGPRGELNPQLYGPELVRITGEIQIGQLKVTHAGGYQGPDAKDYDDSAEAGDVITKSMAEAGCLGEVAR